MESKKCSFNSQESKRKQQKVKTEYKQKKISNDRQALIYQ